MDKKTNQKIVDISTTLFDNVAFVFFHVMETFSKDFLEVRGLRSRGFQLLLHELQQRCARNFEKKRKTDIPRQREEYEVLCHATFILRD